MDFQPYVHVDQTYNVFMGLLALFVFGAISAGLTALVCRFLPLKDKISPALYAAAGFGVAGLFIGLAFSYSVDNNTNMEILKQNIAQKYGDQIELTDMGIAPNSKGAPYRAVAWQAHEVKIKTDGKTSVAILSQDKDTNEPTLVDFDTKQPLPELNKEK